MGKSFISLMNALTPHSTPAEHTARQGVICAIIAYTMWGFFPIYFKIAHMVPAVEMLSHRILWSVPFGAIIILWRKQVGEVLRALKSRRKIILLGLAAFFIAVNWGVYIMAVLEEQIFQASLGYYINPLMYVIVGVAIFGEKLTRPQMIAVILAAVGVAILTLYGGQFPWISLILASSFTIYGIIRKQVEIGGMPGLFIETILLLPFAAAYIFWISAQGESQFVSHQPDVMGLLILAGPLTVIPLLMFALAARRLPLSTLGFLQFIGPTLQFCVGVAYGEEVSSARLICMMMIWSAVIIFCWGALQESRKLKPTHRIKTH